jgi:CRP-like cAMP-binding protein
MVPAVDRTGEGVAACAVHNSFDTNACATEARLDLASLAIAEEYRVVELAAGEVLFRAGDAADCLYVVLEGRADVLLPDGQLIESAGSGAIIGELAMIDKAARSATVVSRARSRMLAIDEELFRELVRRDPDFSLEVMRVLVNRLRRMNKRLMAQSGKTYSMLSDVV